MNSSFITVAKIAKAQGRKGEVAAAILTDFPQLFAERTRLFVLDDKDVRREFEVEEHWFHKSQVVFKFAGVDSISEAELLLGCEVQIPHSERAELEQGSLYISELTGCTVFADSKALGFIEDVQFGAGEAPLLVIKGSKEYLVPFASEYIERISVAEKRVEMKLPEGMLALDAPLKGRGR